MHELQKDGAKPVIFLKAIVKQFEDEKPTSKAMSVMDFDVFFNRIIAIFILYLINNEKSTFIIALQKSGVLFANGFKQ